MDNRDIFIFIRQRGCGPCEHFKMSWPAIKQELEKIVNVIDIEFTEWGNSNDMNKLPRRDLGMYIRGFPCFMFIQRSKWTTNDAPKIFNADVNPNNIEKLVVPYGPTDTRNRLRNLHSFLEWIKENKSERVNENNQEVKRPNNIVKYRKTKFKIIAK